MSIWFDILICLCGMPQEPRLGGVRGGRTPNTAMICLLKDLSGADRIRTVLETRAASNGQLAQKLAELQETIDHLLRQRRLRRQAHRVVPSSNRTPAGYGKDLLISSLQRIGCPFRKSRMAVDAIISIWTDELRQHFPVETPLGWIGTPAAPNMRTEIRFGRLCGLFPENRRVRLTKKKRGLFNAPGVITGLERVAASSIPVGSEPTQSQRPTTLVCVECGGSYFTEVTCSRYQRDFASSWPGGDLVRVFSEQSIPTAVCFCGCPLNSDMPTIPKLLRASFKASLEKATLYRDQEAFKQRLQKALTERVTAEQFNQIREKASRIEALFNFLASKPVKVSKSGLSFATAPCIDYAQQTSQSSAPKGPLTKYNLGLELSGAIQLPPDEAHAIVHVVFETIVRACDTGRRVDIRGFGSFSARRREARRGRNPRTHERFEAVANTVAHFKPSKRLRKLVNESPNSEGSTI